MPQNSFPICPQCQKQLEVTGASFCPYCGASVRCVQTSSLPEGAKQVLRQADATKDPVEKHAMLLQAQKDYPDCLEVAEALLFLGRLHERDSRTLDFSVIKCYLWHMYLTPKDFTDAQQDAFRRELFEHPQLKRCQELYGDADAYTRRYLRRLAGEFVALFLKGSNTYTRTWFGFRFDNRMSRVLAAPAAQMLKNMSEDEHLSPWQRSMLFDAFYQGFLAETGDEPQWLDEKLDALGAARKA